MKKITLIIFILILPISIIYAEKIKANDILKADGEIIRTILQTEIDKIKEMPITLFPEKTERDLVLLRKGFKKYYFIPSKIERIKFDFEKKKENLLKGFYKSARVYVKPCLIKRFPVYESYFYLKNARINRKAKTIDYESIKFFFIIDLKQVSEYIYTECIKHGIQWPGFSLKDRNILLRGSLKIVGLDLKVRALGYFEISDLREIYFKVLNAKFSFVPVPGFVIRQIMKKLNPMIGLEELPLGLYPFRIVYYDDNKIGLVFKTDPIMYKLLKEKN